MERADSKLKLLEGKRKIDFATQIGRHVEFMDSLHADLSITYGNTKNSNYALKESVMDIDLRV